MSGAAAPQVIDNINNGGTRMVATGNVIRDKSYEFALSVVKTVRRLRAREREFELSGQLVRAATSIGANVEEAIAGQSRRDFAAKMAIASKEARETKYWLRLMADAEMLNVDGSHRLLEQCEELVRILTSIVKTAQQRT